jgi:hypothetical protein
MSKLFETPSDLGEYLFRIVDNGGASADRYTVAFSDGSYLMMSGHPTHPQGVSMAGENLDVEALAEEVEEEQAVDLALGDLPEHIVQHIVDRCNQAFSDFLADAERGEPPPVVAPSREAAKAHQGIHTDFGVGIYRTEDGYHVRRDGSDASDDGGPFATVREAVLYTLPSYYSLSGPEYHSTLDPLRQTKDPEVAEAVARLEKQRDDEYEARFSRPAS